MLLNYVAFGQTNKTCLILIHGLFGSLQNLNYFTKELAKNFHVIAVDCRNHGKSFHTNSMSYVEMASDIIKLLDHLNVKETIIIGHSMGGKIAMAVSQVFPNRVKKLIVIDIAPKQYANHHQIIINALLNLNLAKYESRSDVSNELKKDIPDIGLRQFLIKNIDPKKPLKWNINLSEISKSYTDIMDWPEKLSKPSAIQCCFIIGTKSNYIASKDEALIKKIYPNSIFNFINASHWLHAEKPKETLGIIKKFLLKT